MIVILDYGLGNVQAFLNLYKRQNILSRSATTGEELSDATHIILPGVGAFDQAMEAFTSSGLRKPLEEIIKSRVIPVLGICVGMQILACRSDEGQANGLGWIQGEVKSFSNATGNAFSGPLPHMGWNNIVPTTDSPLLKGLTSDARFYFLHSFFFKTFDDKNSIAETEYGLKFSSAVNRDNVFGVQFHPEKSHHWGELLLRNFAKI